MANFRCERLYVMLDDPVPGLDHLHAVDPVAFSRLDADDLAEQAGLTPFGDFTFAPFERPRWRPAREGLETTRGLIVLYRRRLAEGRFPPAPAERALPVLAQVEAVLEAADARDRRFYLAAKDLG